MSPTPDNSAASRATPLFITLVMATAFFMEMFDSTVIVTALPTMASDFNSSVVSLSLGLTAYLLATAVLLPASGWIADRYGTRTVFCLATTLFIASSIWCGLSQSVHEFVLARCMQGIGAALMSPVGRLVVLRITPREQLVNTMNLLVVPGLIGPVIAPPIGGLITTYASWRWCFFINVPIGLVILYLAYRHIGNLRSDAPRRFDHIGFTLNGLCLACLIYGLDQLNERWPGDLFSYGLIGAGAVLLAGALHHARHATHPLVRLDSFRIPSFRVSLLAGGGLSRLVVSALMFLLPLMFQIGMGLSAFHSGLLILMHTGGDLLTKVVTNRFLNRAGFRAALISSVVVFAGCLGMCAGFSRDTPYWWICLVLFTAGAARSLQLGALSALQFADIAPETMTDASTLVNIVQQIYRALGITLGALILNLAVSLRAADAAQALIQFDFRVGFVLMALLSLSALIWFLPLRKDMGAQLLRQSRI